MTSFTSSEKRLWIAALVLQLAIYLSLSLGDNVVRFLRQNNLLRWTVGLILVGCLAATVWLLRRAALGPGAWIATAVMLVIYVVVLLNVHRPEEKLHIVEYGLITGLIFEALRLRFKPASPLVKVFVISLLAGSALGWLDEGIQHLLPDRVYEFSDAVLNFGAALLAAFSLALIHRVSRAS